MTRTVSFYSKLFSFIALILAITRGSPYGRLSVHGPSDLVKDITDPYDIPFNLGNFGHVPWGTSFVGHAYVSEPVEACDRIDVKKMAILPDDKSPILFVTRGGCTFVTKAHYAQIAGFKIIIIVDAKYEAVSMVEMMPDASGYGKT